MTFCETGLMKAMKSAYRQEGYTVYGTVFVLREGVEPENKIMLNHLEQLQWIPVELEESK